MMRIPLQAFAMVSAVRSFPMSASIPRLSRGLSPSSTRFFSTADGPDTSVVETCTEKIKEALGTDKVTVTGAYDDPNGSHISIEVVSDKFEGKRAVQRQQMVYKAIWEEMQGPVHAVDSMVCKSPDEA